MKKYLVEFTYVDGYKEKVEFETDRFEWTINQYYRNRAIADHIILEKKIITGKQMLLG